MALLLSGQFPLFSYAKRAVYFPFAEENDSAQWWREAQIPEQGNYLAAMRTAPG